jgi:hypothetical protein
MLIKNIPLSFIKTARLVIQDSCSFFLEHRKVIMVISAWVLLIPRLLMAFDPIYLDPRYFDLPLYDKFYFAH